MWRLESSAKYRDGNYLWRLILNSLWAIPMSAWIFTITCTPFLSGSVSPNGLLEWLRGWAYSIVFYTPGAFLFMGFFMQLIVLPLAFALMGMMHFVNRKALYFPRINAARLGYVAGCCAGVVLSIADFAILGHVSSTNSGGNWLIPTMIGGLGGVAVAMRLSDIVINTRT